MVDEDEANKMNTEYVLEAEEKNLIRFDLDYKMCSSEES